MNKKISLKTKFTGLIFLLIAATMGLTGSLILRQVKGQLLDEMRKRVTLVAAHMAATNEEALLTKDDLSLGVAIDRIAQDKSVRYAVLLDEYSNTIAHSDHSIPKGTSLPDDGPAPETLSEIRLAERPGGLTEVTAPILVMDKRLATLRIGFSNQDTQKAIERTKRTIGMITAVIFLLGFAVSYALVSLITRPLSKLSEAVSTISQGNLDTQIEISSRDEIGEFAAAFNDMTRKVKTAQEHLLEQERFKQELKIAQTIQQSLLPKEAPHIPGYDIQPYYKAAKEIGGDYYDFIPLSNNRWAVVIADVSGKGVPGSLGMAVARSIFRSEIHQDPDPAVVLTRTNERVHNEIKRGVFVSMFLAIFDPRTGALDCSNAGHNPPVLTQKGKPNWIDLGGLALGIDRGGLFAQNVKRYSTILDPGDQFTLYTDGITEAKNAQDEDFGEERLLRCLADPGVSGSKERIQAVVKAVEEHAQGMAQSDDITLICMTRS